MHFQSSTARFQSQAATMLSYLDVFKIMAIACVPVIVLVLFVKNIDRNEKFEPVGH